MVDVRTWGLGALSAVILLLCWKMIGPFVPLLTWALALAILVNPLRGPLLRRVSNTTAAALIVVVVIIVLAVPAALVAHRVVLEAIRGQQAFREMLHQRPIVAPSWLVSVWMRVQAQIDLGGIAQQASAWLAARAAAVVGKSAVILTEAAMSLFVLFFFIRDQEAITAAVRRLLPLAPEEIDTIAERVSSAIKVSVGGRVLMGAIQGALGGIIFLILGIPAPLLWAVVMAVLATLPFVGAPLVWVPAAIVLFISGHWVKAVVLVAYGVAIIHPVDNILGPVIVSPRMGLHPLLLLIAFVGGLIAFGGAGFILGPAIVAVAVALGDIWGRRVAA